MKLYSECTLQLKQGGYQKVTTSEVPDKIDHCPALVTIKAISGKWKTRILWLMRSGEIQFNDLRRNLRGVSAKVLTEHLRQLEDDGIIFHAKSIDHGVIVSRYGFTEYGSTLIPVLDALGQWGLLHENRIE